MTTQVAELSYLHSRNITFAVFCQGPYDEGANYSAFMGWDMPWYSAQGPALDALLTGRKPNTMYLVCYLREGEKVFETYWTTRRGRGGDGLQLRTHGPHAVRTSGAVGGIACWLAAEVYLYADSHGLAHLGTRVARRHRRLANVTTGEDEPCRVARGQAFDRYPPGPSWCFTEATRAIPATVGAPGVDPQWRSEPDRRRDDWCAFRLSGAEFMWR